MKAGAELRIERVDHCELLVDLGLHREHVFAAAAVALADALSAAQNCLASLHQNDGRTPARRLTMRAETTA